ncbi:MAG: hypothetical protein IH991_06805 [Planctomycetes bacterium]|nr:hypothetical protein [Planctomycetota bacterium]
MIRKTVCLFLILSMTTANAEDAVDLPLRKVVIFNSGLGYFEHEKQIEGTVEVELKFDKTDINDLLKSLVVQDMGGGQIRSVSYPSRSPISEQLRNFSMDLTKQPTLGELLHQLRGEDIRLDGKTTGTIIGVELKPHNVGQQVINREVLNILTEKGLRGVPLDSVGDIAFVNGKIDTELRDALKLLVAGRRADKKTVRFKFVGDGKRTVRIGYIRETPIWKTSYRVVLNGNKPALLQGWAILENTSESDWDQVALTLTSGRPVTFQMDLYRPLYVERQRLLPSVPPSLASRVYSPALEKLDMDEQLAQGARSGLPQAHLVTSQLPILGPAAGMVGGFGGGMGGMGGGGAGFGSPGGAFLAGPAGGADGKRAAFDASEGVVAQAKASEIGEQFQYTISNPVTLASGRSAMIPIVDQNIKAEKLSIFTVGKSSLSAGPYGPLPTGGGFFNVGDNTFATGANEQHPMLAFRLTNTTDIRLSGGPVTVFDDGAYAGDARIEYIRPEEKRLIAYAQDIDLKLRYVLEEESRKLRRVWLSLGVVRLEFDLERKHRYRIQSQSNDDRKLVLEQPRDSKDWTLHADSKPAEKTDDLYRFELAIPAEKTVAFVVAEQNSDEQQFDLKKIDLKTLEGLSRRKDIPEDIMKTILQVRHLRVGLADLAAKLQLEQKLLSDIKIEQSRIRSNMSALNRDADLYRRYVTKLTKQEDNFDKAVQVIAQTRIKHSQMRRELEKFFPCSKDDKVDVPIEAAAVKDPFGNGP